MNILMAASEMEPLVRLGGLADAVGGLARGLAKLGHQVAVVLPFYRAIREDSSLKIRKSGVRFQVPLGPNEFSSEIYETKTRDGVRVFLVGRDEFFDRTGVYGTDGRDYQDNAARFVFFSKSVLELVRRMEPAPDVLHLHSWEAALVAVFARDQRLGLPAVLTPHDLAYQGNFWSYDFALTNLPGEYFSARGVEYYGSMNCLKAGLLFADVVVLRGERMVCDAQTPAEGCGLESVLREQAHKLCGILPALPDADPASDKMLAQTFSADHPAGRRTNRQALLKAVGMAEFDGPLFWVAAEASRGEGADVLWPALDRILTGSVRVLFTGKAAETTARALEIARRKHAGALVVREALDEKLLHLALGGADFLLVPGASEPHSLWIRRALRYGCIPIARQCGGLPQLVKDWDEGQRTGTGLVFWKSSDDALVDICRRAARLWTDPERRDLLRRKGMSLDVSETAAARDHESLYLRLTAGRPAKAA